MSDQSPPPGWTPRDPDTPAGPPAQESQQPRKPQRPSGEKQSRRAAEKAERKRKRTGWRRLVPTWRMVLGAVLLLALLVIGALIAGYLLVRIPPANAAATAQSNLYLYADGSQLARDGEVNRVNVPLSQIPRTVQEAVLAAEDRDFHSNGRWTPRR